LVESVSFCLSIKNSASCKGWWNVQSCLAIHSLGEGWQSGCSLKTPPGCFLHARPYHPGVPDVLAPAIRAIRRQI